MPERKVQYAMRLDAGVMARIDALIPPSGEEDIFGAKKEVTRTHVIRAAIMRGLPLLEQEAKADGE